MSTIARRSGPVELCRYGTAKLSGAAGPHWEGLSLRLCFSPAWHLPVQMHCAREVLHAGIACSSGSDAQNVWCHHESRISVLPAEKSMRSKAWSLLAASGSANSASTSLASLPPELLPSCILTRTS